MIQPFSLAKSTNKAIIQLSNFTIRNYTNTKGFECRVMTGVQWITILVVLLE